MALLGNLTGSAPFFQDVAPFYNNVATQSLRFDDGSSAYLARTATAGNRRTWTFSTWLKRANLTGAEQHIFQGGTYSGGGGTQQLRIKFNSDNKFNVTEFNGASTTLNLITDAVFRDVSAWYHIVVAFDTTQATSTDRVKIYINGTLQTLGTATYPSQNLETYVNQDTKPQELGRRNDGTLGAFLDAYLADSIMVDGTQLDPTSFGETKNGVWIPKAYTGSYGTNGFRLQFNQTGVGTGSSSTIGADTSGNDNHFSSSGIVASDCDMPDSPENNWSTMNSLINGYGTNITMSEGNLAGTGTSAQYNNTLGTILMTSGKWYWEISSADFNNYIMLGIAIETALQTGDSTPYGQTGVVAYATHGASYVESNSGSAAGTYTDFLDSEIIGVAVDLDASPRTVKFYNDNTLQFTENLSSNFDDIGILPFFCIGTADTIKVNFGQDSSFAGLKTAQGNTDANGIGDFYYSPPSGYLALCTSNLPEPTISPNADTQADDYINTVLYTGTNATQSITGVGFQPDWVWLKSRSNAQNNRVFDVIRGTGEYLETDTTDAEGSSSTSLTSFDSDGFSLGGSSLVNTNTYTYVAWNWKAGGTAVSNTDGTITSSVSANTDAGFSIVSYTGNSTAGATVGHGLGSVPNMIIVKCRSDSSSSDHWYTYHSGIASDAERYEIYLNLTARAFENLNLPWNNTAPTSSVFSLGSLADVNETSETYIAYCFAEIESYSKFGSYTGNGSSDGTFVYTGFRPAIIITKKTTDVGDWVITDVTRSPSNENTLRLEANTSDAELDDTGGFDMVSNGFKIRNNFSAINASGATYIYMAFAENPFKYANAR